MTNAEPQAVPSCPRCAQASARTRYDFGRERIVQCLGCGLLYLDPWPTEADLRSVYGDSYFQNPVFLDGHNESLYGYADYIAERLIKQADYVRVAREIRALLPGIETPRLLEVGCGFGYFLDVAFEEGFSVTGLEFNEYAVARLRKKYAFPVHSGALETTPLGVASFDAAALFDVIEHLRDPFGALDKLHQTLAPGGLLVISTMDAESLSSRILGKRLEDFRRTREHLFFFGRRTLIEVLDEHGFDVLTVRSIGHTFEIAFLLDRLALIQPTFFRLVRTVVVRLGLGSVTIRVNPRTKMIAFARRRA
jgi:SAM-dependent methyltransferase